MGIYKYPEIRDYWKRNVTGARLGLCRDRFNQIQAVFTFRNPEILPIQPSDPWWSRLEPLASSIRASCQRYWIPGAKLAVDEGMIAYHGHTRHTIKAPHKPIKQGFKFWALGDHGFIVDWLWYSRTAGTEATRRSVALAETQNLVLNLARRLPRSLGYNFYLDNLFTNVPLAKELLNLNVGMTGTTRKNALGFPMWLVKLKEQGKSRGKAMEWGAMRAEVVEGVLCFAWQDNNTVLGITTAYSPDDLVVRTRKRPAETSTNAAIVRPVFGDEYTKDLAIPKLIDEYNHHMGGVDIANQLRASYSTHNRRQKRYWKPLFLWLLDLAITNSYLISQWPRPNKPESRGHRRFMDNLAKSLMEIPLDLADVEPPADAEPPERPDVEPLERPESPATDRPESPDTERGESPDTERPERPDTEQPDVEQSDVQRPDIEWPNVEWPDVVEWPDAVEWPDVEWPLNIEPPSSSLLESADLGNEIEIHVQEKRGKRAYCVSCLQHKEDWEPHKHKPNHAQRQVLNRPRAFGTDLTNIMPSDTRGYRIRGSRTIWYCGTCDVALCKRGSCWNLWHNR
jgi:hypothetical protein